MANDLTAILVRGAPADERGALEAELRAIVVAHVERRALAESSERDRDVVFRVVPLAAVGLTQVEVFEPARGLPSADPELVARLSVGGRRAVFVHVNHQAGQAMLHAFVSGAPDGNPEQASYVGAPDERFAARLLEATGATLEQITSADDGSRLGIGIAASHTVARIRGRELQIPSGAPIGLGAFAFHDRGADLRRGGERLALFAFDPLELERLHQRTPARELAARLATAPAARFGPLAGAREEIVATLAALGDQSPAESGRGDVRLLELCALECALVWSGGETVVHLDKRVLPLFSLAGRPPVLDADEARALESSGGILHALVEVLPSHGPPGGEGTLVASFADDELGPLAPWARPGDEYAGAIFVLRPDRLLDLVRGLSHVALQQTIEQFVRAWGEALGVSDFDSWRRAKEEASALDVDRFLVAWAELRAVLEIARVNQLAVALLFYGAVGDEE